MLHDEVTPRSQQDRGTSRNLQRDPQTVGAAPVQRDLRVMVAHLRVVRDRARGDVWRVAHHHVHTRFELGKRKRRVAEPDVHVEAEVIAVTDRPGVSQVGQLDAVDLGSWDLVLDGQGDRPRARAKVHHYGRNQHGSPAQEVAQDGNGEAGHELGLEAGDEDTRPDRKIEPAEPCLAGQMLQRHPSSPLGDQIIEPIGDGRAHDHQLAHLARARPQHMRSQGHRVKLGTVDAGVGQGPDRVANSLTQRRRRP